jgi:hypothetical protein
MKRFLILFSAALLIAGFVAFMPHGAKASGGPTNTLLAVTTVSKNDVWAAGMSVSNPGSRTLVEHLVNNKWQVVPSPQPAGTQYASLAGTTGTSGHDVWAVGSSTTSNGSSQTLIEHWNGAHLNIVSSPNPQGSRGSFLTAVTSVSKNDVWAVGVNNASDGTTGTLIERWNGQSWQIVSSPNVGSDSFLEAVSAVSKNDVWAVGESSDFNNSNNESALIEHWNGYAWEIIPDAAPAGTILKGVSAISKNDVWAVGYYFNGSVEAAVIERWNGQSWHLVATPASSQDDFLMAVSAVSHNDVWAVGSAHSQGHDYTTLIEHWNGHAWSIVSSPNPNGSTSSGLNGVAGISHKNAWTVGSGFGPGLSITLTEHWNGHAWSIVSSPTP